MKKLSVFLILILIAGLSQIAKIQIARAWGGDVLITNGSNVAQVKPSMASTPDGDIYMASEGLHGASFISIFRSTDGGVNWSYITDFWLAGVDDLCNPCVTYAEGAGQKWVYVAYEANHPDGSRSVQVLRFNPDDSRIRSVHTVVSGIFMCFPDHHIYPQICTDNLAFNHYYIYITYTVCGVDYYPVMFSRSTNFGVNWSTPQNLTGGAENSMFLKRPHIAFGTPGLFVVFEKLGWSGSGNDIQVFVTKSTNYGISWNTPVQLTNSSDDQYHPRVAAANGLNSVVVAYTRDWAVDGDSDICYAYSTDGGASWNRDRLLPWTFDDEESVDLSVSNNSGKFHAAFWRGYDIHYTCADAINPALWSPTVVVNAGSRASRNYSKPTLCVNPTEPLIQEACVAWTDFRGPFYEIYFDSASAMP